MQQAPWGGPPALTPAHLLVAPPWGGPPALTPPAPPQQQVMLQLEKKLFDYFNQEVFRDDNGTAVSPAAALGLPSPLAGP